jgi:hypothetical protein
MPSVMFLMLIVMIPISFLDYVSSLRCRVV